MKTKFKRLLSLLLALVMVLSALPTGVLAAGGALFPRQKTFTENTFTDVTREDWFYENVESVYEFGLMVGKSAKDFDYRGEITLGETVAIAARLHASYHSGEDFVQGTPWYRVYADYALAQGILEEEPADYAKAATRAQFARILASALPDKALQEINRIADGAIPDVNLDADYARDVYKLYRAGILMGQDSKGVFAPLTHIQRCEVAAIVSRMADEGLRERFHLGKDEGTSVRPGQPDTEEPEEPEEPEETKSPEEMELDAIADLNGGELPFIALDEEDYIPSAILGKFSEETVTNAESAIGALEDIQAIMNMEVPEEEFADAGETSVEETNYFRLQQCYEGVEVYGRQLIIAADAGGEVLSLTGNYDPMDGKLDKTQNLSMEQALEIALAGGYSVDTDGKLVIYTVEEGYDEYAWMFTGMDTVLVSAIDGVILDSWTNVYTAYTPAIGTGKNTSGNMISFPTVLDDRDTVSPSDDTYILYDEVRNIWYKDLGGASSGFSTYQAAMDWVQLIDADNRWNVPKAVSLTNTLSKVYDYYLETIGLLSYNGNGGRIVAFVNDGKSGNNAYSYGSGADKNGQQMTFVAFGKNRNYEDNINVVGHEFTHSVQRVLVNNLKYEGETGALMEGYADVAGELIEGWYNASIDWKNTLRNMRDPLSDGLSLRYNGVNYGKSVHKNSTVLSHAIYQIYTAGMKDIPELTELLFRAWHYLSPTATFADYRLAILAAAKDMGLGQGQIRNIVAAFDAADVQVEEYDQFWFSTVSLNTTVVDLMGTPIPNAVVEVVNTDGKSVAKAGVDGSGKCSVSLRAGSYTVHASAIGYITERIALNVKMNTDAVLQIRLIEDAGPDRIQCVLSGLAFDAAVVTPLPNVTLTFRKGYNVRSGRAVKTLVTRADGEYQVEGLDYGVYTVQASKPGYATTYEIVQASAVNWDDAERIGYQNFWLTPLRGEEGETLKAEILEGTKRPIVECWYGIPDFLDEKGIAFTLDWTGEKTVKWTGTALRSTRPFTRQEINDRIASFPEEIKQSGLKPSDELYQVTYSYSWDAARDSLPQYVLVMHLDKNFNYLSYTILKISRP